MGDGRAGEQTEKAAEGRKEGGKDSEQREVPPNHFLPGAPSLMMERERESESRQELQTEGRERRRRRGGRGRPDALAAAGGPINGTRGQQSVTTKTAGCYATSGGGGLTAAEFCP